MALIESAKRAVGQALTEAGETAIRSSMPGLTTAANTVSKFVKEARERKAKELSQASEGHQKHTVEEAEYDFAKKAVGNFWSMNPFRLLIRAFRWIAPGFSNAEAHQTALKPFTAYAKFRKANYYANDAVSFLLTKIKSLTSRGLLSRLFFSADYMKSDPLISAYVESCASWIKALDKRNANDVLILREHLATLKDEAIPQFIREKLSSVVKSKIPN